MKRLLNLGDLAGILPLLLTPTDVQAQTNLVPFPWDWSRAHESVLDLSRFLGAPAGQGGHVRVRDGHSQPSRADEVKAHP